jgi:hypothetical protein
MEDWWVSLEMFDKAVWIIAFSVSLIFLIQTVMTFIGMDSDMGMDADFDGDMTDDSSGPFQLFTFRNFINFFLGFSWTVIAFRQQVPNLTLLVLIASFVGTAIVAGIMFMFYFMGKMQQSGTMDIQQSVGKSADVYLTIPGYKNGMGKVHVNVQGSIRELDAITEADTLPSGSLVKVVSVIEERVLVVEKLN